ncbi:hypothetical protein [Mitsuaria sp. BK037]|uniref:hypothetical protein n=1 Tax=Mitsuaria sp. BK037 TaxID=2587122 RepID=UPI0016077911|nr:hypothetical protein [Mitsuaria sp. BK037]MBB3281856.1 hypothetical protein [Mitsuaria sp. BK037]
MSVRRVAALAAVLGALAGLVAGSLVGPGREPVTLAEQVIPPTTARPARPDPAFAAGAASAPRLAPLLAGTDGRVDLGALLRAPLSELRTSVLTALRHRSEGGWLYARALARQCSALEMVEMREHLAPAAFQPAIDLNQPGAQRALTLRDQLMAGCSQLQPDELLEAMNVPPGAADPLIAVMDQPARPGSAEARERLAAILARPDPLMLAELGPNLLARDGEALVFDGRRIDGEERQLLEGAALLLPCSLGLACDGQDEAVWGPCLVDGLCGTTTREDAVMATVNAGEHPERRAAVLAWVERLRTAVVARDVDRFLKPPA